MIDINIIEQLSFYKLDSNHVVYFLNSQCCIFQKGTVNKVDPAGYVTVLYDDGSELKVNAGARGIFDVELLNK